jgi:hypothetical protein
MISCIIQSTYIHSNCHPPLPCSQMTPLIQNSVSTLVEVLRTHSDTGQSVEVFRYVVCINGEQLVITHNTCSALWNLSKQNLYGRPLLNFR